MAEKNLPPSQQRIRQAREKGQIGISKDLINLVKLGVLGEIVFGTEHLWRNQIEQMLIACMLVIAQPQQMRWHSIAALISNMAALAVFLACTAAIIALTMTLLQTRFNVAGKAFDAGIDKLNPGNNLKQIISGEKLLMLPTGLLKLLVVVAVCYFHILDDLPILLQLPRLTLEQGWKISIDILHSLLRSALLALMVLGVFDFGLQRYMTWRKQRMDIEEMKREYKENEGDPHTKSSRKQATKEMLHERKSSAAAKPHPNVVVANPQHIAIGLTYDVFGRDLPRISVRTTGQEALQLRRYAARERIPVIRYVALARLLYATGREGGFIPSQTVRAVAFVCNAARELANEPIYPGEEFEIDAEIAKALLPQAVNLSPLAPTFVPKSS